MLSFESYSTLYVFSDRTLSLLKEGAKALTHKLNTSAQMDPVDLPSPQYLSPCKFRSTSNLKQMLLTDKLQLKTSDKIVNVGCVTALALGTSCTALRLRFSSTGYPDRPLWMLPVDRSIYSKRMLLLRSGTVFLLSVCMHYLLRIVLSELLSACVSHLCKPHKSFSVHGL